MRNVAENRYHQNRVTVGRVADALKEQGKNTEISFVCMIYDNATGHSTHMGELKEFGQLVQTIPANKRSAYFDGDFEPDYYESELEEE